MGITQNWPQQYWEIWHGMGLKELKGQSPYDSPPSHADPLWVPAINDFISDLLCIHEYLYLACTCLMNDMLWHLVPCTVMSWPHRADFPTMHYLKEMHYRAESKPNVVIVLFSFYRDFWLLKGSIWKIWGDQLAYVVTKSLPFTRSGPLLRSRNWLPIKFRILFNITLLTYKTLHEKQPVYLHSMFATSLPSHSLTSNKGISLSVLGSRPTQT